MFEVVAAEVSEAHVIHSRIELGREKFTKGFCDRSGLCHQHSKLIRTYEGRDEVRVRVRERVRVRVRVRERVRVSDW